MVSWLTHTARDGECMCVPRGHLELRVHCTHTYIVYVCVCVYVCVRVVRVCVCVLAIFVCVHVYACVVYIQRPSENLAL